MTFFATYLLLMKKPRPSRWIKKLFEPPLLFGVEDVPFPPEQSPRVWRLAEEMKEQTGVAFDLYLKPVPFRCAWAVDRETPPRVVLSKALLEADDDELRWTLAHEIGHLTRPSLRRYGNYLMISVMASLLLLPLLLALGSLRVIDIFELTIGVLLVPPLVVFLLLCFLAILRREEAFADAYAREQVGHGPAPSYFDVDKSEQKSLTRPWLRAFLRIIATHPLCHDRMDESAPPQETLPLATTAGGGPSAQQ